MLPPTRDWWKFWRRSPTVVMKAMPKLPPQLRKKLVSEEARLFWSGRELRVGDDRERNEEEGVAEALQSAGQGVVAIVGVEVEVAVVEEGDADDHDGAEEQDARAG